MSNNFWTRSIISSSSRSTSLKKLGVSPKKGYWQTEFVRLGSHHHCHKSNGNSSCITWYDCKDSQKMNYSVHPSSSTTKANKANNNNGDETLLKRKELIPVNLNCIRYKYENNIPLTMLTATDYHSSSVVDQTNCDMILVGDSLSMTALGQPNTTSVTMDEMIHHAKAVKKGSNYSFLIGDMPFGSYTNDESAVHNAVRFIKESEMNAVKLEGGERVASKIRAIVDAGIVVIGHIGLTPQSSNQLGGFRVVGSKSCDEAIQVWKDALAVKKAGASLIVLECVPQKLAALITKEIGIPVIGIGSGQCSGQVLVYHDILGMYSKFTPKFCKQYLELNSTMIDACEQYVQDVVGREFPEKSHTFIIKDDVYKVVSEYIENEVALEKKSVSKGEENSVKFTSKKKKLSEEEEVLNYDLDKRRIVVLGSGSVGSLVASSLNENSHNNQVRYVSGRGFDSVVGSGKSLIVDRRLNVDTLNIEKIGQTTIESLNENELMNDWSGEIDLLIIAVKTFATKQAIQNLLEKFPNIKNIKNIVTVQNGFNNEETIVQAFAHSQTSIPKRVLPICIYSGVKTIDSMEKPEVNGERRITIEQAVSQIISISLPKSVVNTEIGELFSKNSNFHVKSLIGSTLVNGKEMFVDWTKLIVNSTINPVAAMYQVENGEIAENIHLQEIIKQLLHEQLHILKNIPGAIHSLASSQELKEISLEDYMFDNILKVVHLTKSNRCSMMRDVENMKSTEILNLNGAFVSLAKELKLPRHQYATNAMISEMVNAKLLLKE